MNVLEADHRHLAKRQLDQTRTMLKFLLLLFEALPALSLRTCMLQCLLILARLWVQRAEVRSMTPAMTALALPYGHLAWLRQVPAVAIVA